MADQPYQTTNTAVVEECPGPLVWFDVEAGPPRGERAAVLECRCEHLTVTGNCNEAAHAHTPILRSPT